MAKTWHPKQVSKVTVPTIQLCMAPKSAAPCPPANELAPIGNNEKPIAVTTVAATTGDMILTEKIVIDERMTASELHDALSAMGASLIVKTLAEIEAGTAPRTPQTDENTCYASMINKDMCRIDFSRPIDEVYNLIRGMSASPCAFTTLGGKRLKVYFAEKTDTKTDLPAGQIDKRVNVGDGRIMDNDLISVSPADAHLLGGIKHEWPKGILRHRPFARSKGDVVSGCLS